MLNAPKLVESRADSPVPRSDSPHRMDHLHAAPPPIQNVCKGERAQVRAKSKLRK